MKLEYGNHLTKIKLDKTAIENFSDNKTVNLLLTVSDEIGDLFKKPFLHKLYNKFHADLIKEDSEQNQFNYYNLLVLLNKLYPGEFQKEILK